MTPITKPNSFSRRLIRKKLHMMERAAKWKLKFWPDVEVFIFALEITYSNLVPLSYSEHGLFCGHQYHWLQSKSSVKQQFDLHDSKQPVWCFYWIDWFFFWWLICCFTVMRTLSKSTCASIEVLYWKVWIHGCF